MRSSVPAAEKTRSVPAASATIRPWLAPSGSTVVASAVSVPPMARLLTTAWVAGSRSVTVPLAEATQTPAGVGTRAIGWSATATVTGFCSAWSKTVTVSSAVLAT